MTKETDHIEIILRALIVQDGKILLCHSNDEPPIYYLPGGHLEKGETIDQALKREIKEEIDAKIKKMTFLEFFENFFTWRGFRHHEINFLYDVEVEIKNPQAMKSQEDHISIGWLDIAKLPDFKLLPSCIHQYLVKHFKK